MHLLISMVAAIIPTIVLLQYFLRRDLHRESGELALQVFLWGVFSFLPVLAIEMAIWDFWPVENPFLFSFIDSLFGAAIPEEFFKFFILVVFAARRPEFDEPMDGIVYGAAVSLGFAAMENTVYVLDTGMDQAVARAVTAIPAHASFGAIMGYFVGRAIYHSHRSAAGSLLLGFLCPVGLHTFYNFPLLAIEACDDCHSPRPFLALFLAVLVITLTWAFWLINKLRREQETQLGLADRPRRVR